MADEQNQEIKFNADNLYREELFTDLKVGSIRRFVPVTPDGDQDSARETSYHGQTALMTPAGQVPLNFDLEADSLQAAIDAFPKAAEEEAQRVMQEIQELQRQQQQEQQSRIQVPGGGQQGGGSNIQF